MLDKILALTNRFVPLSIAWKGLQKSNPKVKTFMAGAVAAGYPAQDVLSFLRDKAEGAAGDLEEDSGNTALARATKSDINKRKSAIDVGVSAAGVGIGGLAGAAATQIPGLLDLFTDKEEAPSLSPKDKKDATYKQFRERLRRKDDKMRLREDLEEEEMQALRPKKKKKKKPGLVEEETQRFQNQYGDDAKMRILQSLQQINQQLGGM